jgi:hypothetical protein
MGCEIDNRIEIIAGCAKCDLLAIRDETACGCANRLWQTALDANPAPRQGRSKVRQFAPVSTLAGNKHSPDRFWLNTPQRQFVKIRVSPQMSPQSKTGVTKTPVNY